jgi:MYXO-CTERM domain-containing protein
MRRMRSLTTLSLSLVVAGCLAPVDPASHHSPIINGDPSGPEDDAAVGLPLFSQGGGFQGACSGVLIAPDIVLTARHCVSRTDGQGVACDAEGNPLYGTGGVRSDYEPEQVQVIVGPELSFDFAAKGKLIFRSSVDNLCNNDIAVVVLDQKITNVQFAKVRLDSPPVEDQEILAVGWGQSNNSSGYGRRRRANIPITGVGPLESSVGLALGPNEFQTGEGICQGDSGGPAFDMNTGAVIGVVSRGGNGKMGTRQDPTAPCVDDGPYRTHNIYTRTDTFKDLILQAFKETGEDPWEEKGPDPRKAKTGEACTTPDDCRSAVCVAGMCSTTCTGPDDTACPAGLVCADQGGSFACGPPAPKSSGGCSVAGGAAPGALGALLSLLVAAAALLRRRRA